MSLLAKLRARVGVISAPTPEPTPPPPVADARSRWGGQPVQPSKDLTRILALPRRPVPDDLGPLVAEMSARLRKPEGTQTLFPIQALGLAELAAVGGGLFPIGVGHGKTLLDMLAPMVFPWRDPSRPLVSVLLIPPNLRAQFFREWETYGKHWTLPNLAGGRYFVPGRPILHVVAFSELSSPKSSDLLERLRPDLIIVDEAHNLKRREASRTKRFLRYFSAHPETRFACWSGTLTAKSVKDYAHLAELALHEGSPVPTHWPTVEEWASAIDPVPFPAPPGALTALCRPGENVRSGFRRRLVETRGVVATQEGALGTSLVIGERDPGPVPAKVVEAIEHVRHTWQRPDGEELVEGLAVARCARELACGFFLRWRWPRGEPEAVIDRWLARRKDWHKELREKLKFAREHLDSPMLLGAAAKRYHEGYTGPMPTWRSETWRPWKEVEDTAKPETDVVWVDDFLVEDAAEWARKNVGIVWYESDAVGKRIAKLAGAPLYAGGEEASATIGEESGKRSIVASIRSHGTGKNLQAFSRQLIAQTPSSGATFEQLLGRTHRTGQAADEVEALVYRHTDEMAGALDTAIRDARYISETLGTRQKLVYATYTFDR